MFEPQRQPIMFEPQTLEPTTVHSNPCLIPHTIESQPSTSYHQSNSPQPQTVHNRAHRLLKKKENSKQIEEQVYPNTVHEVEPNLDQKKTHSCNIDSNMMTVDLPIAQRKRVRSCTNHPIDLFHTRIYHRDIKYLLEVSQIFIFPAISRRLFRNLSKFVITVITQSCILRISISAAVIFLIDKF